MQLWENERYGMEKNTISAYMKQFWENEFTMKENKVIIGKIFPAQSVIFQK